MDRPTMQRLIAGIQAKAKVRTDSRKKFEVKNKDVEDRLALQGGTDKRMAKRLMEGKLQHNQTLGQAMGLSDALMIIREEDPEMFDDILAKTTDIGQ